MKNFLLLITVFLALGRGYAQSPDKDFPKSFAVTIANPLNVPRENVLVTITPQQWKKKVKEFNRHAFIVVDGKNEIASQYNANDSDHDGIVFVVDNLGPLETKTVLIRYHPTATIFQGLMRSAHRQNFLIKQVENGKTGNISQENLRMYPT